MRPILVSTCLLGIPTRYDGGAKRSERVIDYLRRNDFVPVPVCPEQLAGLPTPRPKTWFARGSGADILEGEGEIVTEQGEDVSESFLSGARQTARIARLSGCRTAILKERSPSCGVHQIYRGSNKVSGQGVAAALLLRHGLELLGEEDL
ncbi:MAG: DUF523 domain-containing protein [Desulfuromonadales bacterium]|nr:DUF523 domain-containing protein [Desulfuromonadales bacterium]NIR34188.1 DUF523 domain-containing protein [Desulfuromonadales bacterium]NIS41635.1 DUF523 domain-containing protein [Desulfuromonadales bacterium]